MFDHPAFSHGNPATLGIFHPPGVAGAMKIRL